MYLSYWQLKESIMKTKLIFPDYSNSNQRCFVRTYIRGCWAQHPLHRPLAGVHQHGRDQSFRGNASLVRKRMRATWARTHAGQKTILPWRRSLLHQIPDLDGRTIRVWPCKIWTFNSAGINITYNILWQLFYKVRPFLHVKTFFRLVKQPSFSELSLFNIA